MIKRIKEFSGISSSLSIFVLIVSFLLLGSCPLKKAFQVLLKAPVETGHTNSGNGKSLAAKVCFAAESNFSKILLPQRKTGANAPLFFTILFTSFWDIQYLFKSGTQPFSFGEPSPIHLHFVPVYLRNRTLLI